MSVNVNEQDPRLEVKNMKYNGETGEVHAHLAKPKDDKKHPGVVVIHEIWGLNSHIEDITRRVALEGFIAMAPDALSPVGGTQEDSERARDLMGRLDTEKTILNFVAAVKYLKTHPKSTGKVGVTGFCWGGGMTNQVAVNSQDVQVAVPFYGRQPIKEDASKISASMLIHYAGDDERINAGIPEFEDTLKEYNVDYKIYMYEGAKHAFFNDTSQRYDEDSSKLAWKRTIEFFNEKLKT